MRMHATMQQSVSRATMCVHAPCSRWWRLAAGRPCAPGPPHPANAWTNRHRSQNPVSCIIVLRNWCSSSSSSFPPCAPACCAPALCRQCRWHGTAPSSPAHQWRRRPACSCMSRHAHQHGTHVNVAAAIEHLGPIPAPDSSKPKPWPHPSCPGACNGHHGQQPVV